MITAKRGTLAEKNEKEVCPYKGHFTFKLQISDITHKLCHLVFQVRHSQGNDSVQNVAIDLFIYLLLL